MPSRDNPARVSPLITSARWYLRQVNSLETALNFARTPRDIQKSIKPPDAQTINSLPPLSVNDVDTLISKTELKRFKKSATNAINTVKFDSTSFHYACVEFWSVIGYSRLQQWMTRTTSPVAPCATAKEAWLLCPTACPSFSGEMKRPAIWRERPGKWGTSFPKRNSYNLKPNTQ